ncbi:MAG: phosphate ABC transporter substrate-binding protein PstS [Anaerolineales bacterium]
MPRKISLLFVVITVMSIVISACATSTPTTQAPPQAPATVVVTQIVAGTPQTVVITATPGPTEPPAPTALPAGSVQINGAGATFPLPVYTEWIYAYQYVNPSVTLNYQGIGSGGGKKAIIDNTVDFAGSDSLLSADEYTAGKDLQMYPMVAGAVVPIYNVEGVTQTLTLDRNTMVGIYDATITMWNDPAIAALNPGIALPDAAITAVHRSDGSGTTEIFTKALASFSDTWKNNVGAGTSVEWPVDKAGSGIGGKGNQGVAAAVQNTPDSIGYVELSYAIANNIAFANLINKAGNTVTADADTLASAMNDFANTFTDQLTNTIVDGSGANSWPIAGYTYIVLHTTSMTDCVKAQQLVEFLKWALTDPGAAKRAADLGYSVLPDAVRTLVLAKLGEVTCNGTVVSP